MPVFVLEPAAVPGRGRLPRRYGLAGGGSRGSQPLMVPTPGLMDPTLR
jgi:hypothetical protein